MIQGNKKESLTPTNILSKITEYDIFKRYMGGIKWNVNKLAESPFRKERTPSFLISNRGGNLFFIDYGDTSKKGDCFAFVKQLHSCDFNTALKIIDVDFGLGFSNVSTNLGAYKEITKDYKQPEELGKRYSLIQVVTRKFTLEELSYWNQYHQSLDDLRAENVYAIKKLFLNKQLFNVKETELKFGYFYDGHWKIYRPFGTPKQKWVPNNVPITYLEGKENVIGVQKALITKSKKDKMVLRKLFPATCATQNEGIACFSEENVKFLKENSEEQVLVYDSDSAGVTNSTQITSLFDFGYCNVPRSYLSDGINDFADLAKDYGLDKVEKILKRKNIIT